MVPSLIIGEPGSTTLLGRSFCVGGWPADGQLTVGLLDALEPLIPRLASVALVGALLSNNTVAAMGRVLGALTHTLCLSYTSRADGPSKLLLEYLLPSLPHLAVMHADMYEPRYGVPLGLNSLAAACQAVQRCMLVQVDSGFMSEQHLEMSGCLCCECDQSTRAAKMSAHESLDCVH